MTILPRPGPMATGASPSLPVGARRSHALEGLIQYLRQEPGMQIVDFGGINQQNLDFLTGLGHRLYAGDLLQAYSLAMPGEEPGETEHIDILEFTRFLEDALPFRRHSVQVALLWDTLQFLPAQAAEGVLERLFTALSPQGALLSFFHPDNQVAAPQRCRILDDRHLIMNPRTLGRRPRPFNPRSIERFFQRFGSVKFYLTREHLQEVLVRR